MSAMNPPAGAPDRPVRARNARTGTAAKTSAASTFALVFGVAALVCVLTAVLSVVGLVLGIVGVVLGVVGLRMTRRPGVTGRGVAVGGLVLSVIAVLLALIAAAGVTTVINNQSAVNRLEGQVQDLRRELSD
jgi:hypothetical protein